MTVKHCSANQTGRLLTGYVRREQAMPKTPRCAATYMLLYGGGTVQCELPNTHAKIPHRWRHINWGGKKVCYRSGYCIDSYLHGCFEECDGLYEYTGGIKLPQDWM